MKEFEFYNKLQADNGGKVNVIYNNNGNFTITTLDGRAEINELTKTNLYNVYWNLEDAMDSEQLKKYEAYPTYLVERVGSDFANAKVVRMW